MGVPAPGYTERQLDPPPRPGTPEFQLRTVPASCRSTLPVRRLVRSRLLSRASAGRLPVAPGGTRGHRLNKNSYHERVYCQYLKINHGKRMMKIKCLRVCGLAIVAGGLAAVSGCIIRSTGPQPVYMGRQPVYRAPQPVYMAPQPAPPPVMVPAPVMVPEYYVWDGFEWVGVVGGQHYYLGPGNVWLVCEPFRLERFRGWERGHADWREHATRNDHFRSNRNEHAQPRHNGR